MALYRYFPRRTTSSTHCSTACSGASRPIRPATIGGMTCAASPAPTRVLSDHPWAVPAFFSHPNPGPNRIGEVAPRSCTGRVSTSGRWRPSVAWSPSTTGGHPSPPRGPPTRPTAPRCGRRSPPCRRRSFPHHRRRRRDGRLRRRRPLRARARPDDRGHPRRGRQSPEGMTTRKSEPPAGPFAAWISPSSACVMRWASVNPRPEPRLVRDASPRQNGSMPVRDPRG